MLQGHDVQTSPRLILVASSELHDVLLAPGIDDVLAEAAAGHECGISGDVSGPLEERSGWKSLVEEGGPHDLEVLVAERRVGAEVLPENVERRFRARAVRQPSGHARTPRDLPPL
jgi:hypothetical protein